MGRWLGVFAVLCMGSVLGGATRCGEKETLPPKAVDGAVCDTGERRSCTCPGEKWGVQYCLGDGTGWKSCNCQSGFDRPIPHNTLP